jgi:hypothetical protein
MPVQPTVRAVFAHFQNLNLLALIHDLRCGQAALDGWSDAALLCPIAHGLPSGGDVHALNTFGQAANFARGCRYAARRLGADAFSVRHFVESWDEETLSADSLLQQFLELWEERLDDAEVVQAVLNCQGDSRTEIAYHYCPVKRFRNG